MSRSLDWKRREFSLVATRIDGAEGELRAGNLTSRVVETEEVRVEILVVDESLKERHAALDLSLTRTSKRSQPTSKINHFVCETHLGERRPRETQKAMGTTDEGGVEQAKVLFDLDPWADLNFVLDDRSQGGTLSDCGQAKMGFRKKRSPRSMWKVFGGRHTSESRLGAVAFDESARFLRIKSCAGQAEMSTRASTT